MSGETLTGWVVFGVAIAVYIVVSLVAGNFDSSSYWEVHPRRRRRCSRRRYVRARSRCLIVYYGFYRRGLRNYSCPVFWAPGLI